MSSKFKFIMDEKVKVKANGKVGEINGQKLETYKYQGQVRETITYSVNFGSYQTAWYNGDQIESLERYSFDDKFEQGLLNLMIDVNLGEKKYDEVNRLNNEKKKYKDG
ncbi:hypothetical protein [Bacillus sp. T33-2]|uniref:hypothetical protein n=1 Tax=Bacillus sp. T33-2 TaxID=2054168 RepID=UPI000C7670C8|nr:hypothetical protein [Bacillus sp. T33-2]PLR99501.1 hypothetical protein CVD19_00120 [Bacillus sp. T33-2]